MRKTNRKGIMSCICRSPEHDLVWIMEDDKDWEPSIILRVYLGDNFGYPKIFDKIPTEFLFNTSCFFYRLYKRLVISFYYVFTGKSREGSFGGFEISDQNISKADKIIELMEELKERNRIWQEKKEDEES